MIVARCSTRLAGPPDNRIGTDRSRTDGRGHTSISEAAAQGHEDLIRMLLAEGANPNTLNDSGRSALWRSCYNGHVGALKVLLEAGADPSFRDKVGYHSVVRLSRSAFHCSYFVALLVLHSMIDPLNSDRQIVVSIDVILCKHFPCLLLDVNFVIVFGDLAVGRRFRMKAPTTWPKMTKSELC